MIFEQGTPSLFLSHNVKDRPFVLRLSRDLETCGIRCWVDEAELRIGDSLFQKIGDAIEQVDFIGAVLSKHSVKSEWVRRELNVALTQEMKARKVKVLPLLLQPCHIPAFLSDKLYVNFSNPADYVAGLRRVIRACGGNIDTVPDGEASSISGTFGLRGTGLALFVCTDSGDYVPVGVMPTKRKADNVIKVYAIGDSFIVDLWVPGQVFSTYSAGIFQDSWGELCRACHASRRKLVVETFDPTEYGRFGGVEVGFHVTGLSGKQICCLVERIIAIHEGEVRRVG